MRDAVTAAAETQKPPTVIAHPQANFRSSGSVHTLQKALLVLYHDDAMGSAR